MARLLLLFAIIALVYLLLKSYRKKASAQNQAIAEDMVRCAHCGVHLPRSESLRADGLDFCNAQHRDAQHK
ncbi:MAG: PP0621 family protein [Gallionella sp.]